MARKKKHEEHENHERWLISYADFITLLFAFFVVMYSVSAVNEGKFRVLSDALVAAFRSTSKSLEPIQVGQLTRAPYDVPAHTQSAPSVIKTPTLLPMPPDASESEAAADAGEMQRGVGEGMTAADQEQQAGQSGQMTQMAAALEKALLPMIEKDLVTVRREDMWLEVEIKSKILFDPGSARLKQASLPVLDDLANILRPFKNPIRVEGHTDDTVIESPRYPTNWELSAARAASVVHLLSEFEIDPTRLSVQAFAQYHPIADNDTAEGRARNRRVVLVIESAQDMRRVSEKEALKPGKKEQATRTILKQPVDFVGPTARGKEEPTLIEAPIVNPIKLPDLESEYQRQMRGKP